MGPIRGARVLRASLSWLFPFRRSTPDSQFSCFTPLSASFRSRSSPVSSSTSTLEHSRPLPTSRTRSPQRRPSSPLPLTRARLRPSTCRLTCEAASRREERTSSSRFGTLTRRTRADDRCRWSPAETLESYVLPSLAPFLLHASISHPNSFPVLFDLTIINTLRAKSSPSPSRPTRPSPSQQQVQPPNSRSGTSQPTPECARRSVLVCVRPGESSRRRRRVVGV